MLVLGIESSCDETGVALYDGAVLRAGRPPERFRQVFERAGRRPAEIATVAYTEGPGLAGALLVGASFAQGLALALGVPAMGIHHLEGHLLSPLLSAAPPAFPFVAQRHSGYLVGGTSPFGTRKSLPVYMERTILDEAKVYINGGRRGFLLGMAPADVAAATGAVLVDVALAD